MSDPPPVGFKLDFLPPPEQIEPRPSPSYAHPFNPNAPELLSYPNSNLSYQTCPYPPSTGYFPSTTGPYPPTSNPYPPTAAPYPPSGGPYPPTIGSSLQSSLYPPTALLTDPLPSPDCQVTPVKFDPTPHPTCPPRFPSPPRTMEAFSFNLMAMHWIRSTVDCCPPATAVRGGTDQDGSEIFVGRAYHEGDLIPAKVIPAKNIAYVAYNGKEEMKYEFEVLCQGELAWEFASGGSIPDGAIPIGRTVEGEPLYAGRVIHEGSQTIGKVHPSHGHCYIPFNGEEVAFADYEVLCLK